MLTRLVAPAFEGFSSSGTAWPLWAGLVGAVVVGAAGWRRPSAAVLMAAPVLLVSGLLGVVRAADALLLLPLVGGALLLGNNLRLLVPLVLAGAAVSAMRVPLYVDDLTLWEASHAARPDEVQPRLGIARAVVDHHPERALELLQVAPDNPREQREVYEVRARALFALGDDERALLDLRQAAWDDPEAVWANAMLCVHTHERGPCEVATRNAPQDGAVWNGLGIAHIQRSNLQAAVEAFETACSLDEAFCANAEQARRDLLEVQGVPGGQGSGP